MMSDLRGSKTAPVILLDDTPAHERMAPDRVLDEGMAAVTHVLSGKQAGWGRAEWVGALGACQSLLNAVTAAQDLAVVEVARRETVWLGDGTLGEVEHHPGRVALDAADLVAPALGSSHAQAQRRVEQSVRLAAGQVPVEVGSRQAPEATGLHELHHAMRGGRLDCYRAGMLAGELELAPPEVSQTVVSVLLDHLDDDAPTLRRRCRRLIARISPDLLRQRAERARAETGLRRWVAEPGVDAWFGTFPSEDAASAWAAIDHLAHDHVSAGVCSTLEQARGRALTDLVAGHATVQVQVVLTVPARPGSPSDVAASDTDRARGNDGDTAGSPDLTGGSAAAVGTSPGDDAPGVHTHTEGSRCERLLGEHPDDLILVQGPRPSEPVLVSREWLAHHLGTDAVVAPCAAVTGARLDLDHGLSTAAYLPGGALGRLVKHRDGRCRFPGCTVSARLCDLDHVRPWPTGPTSAENLMCLCRRHHRIKQSPGWRVSIAPDGTVTWVDPCGVRRTTPPVDALEVLVLTADTTQAPTPSPSWTPPQHHPPWSGLETSLELTAQHRAARWAAHRRCTRAATLRRVLADRRQRCPVAPPEREPPPF